MLQQLGRAGAVLAASLVLAACGDSNTPTSPKSSPTLSAIQITPSARSAAVRGTTQLTAKGTYSDSSEQDLTSEVAWSSASSSIASVSSSGVVTAVSPGSAAISAMLDGVTGKVTSVVTPAPPVSIQVTAATPSLPVGGTLQLTVIGTFPNGSNQTLTDTVTWSSSVTTVATISNAASSNGLVTAVGVGSTTITATLASVSGSTTLTVTAARLTYTGGPSDYGTVFRITPAGAETVVHAFAGGDTDGAYPQGSLLLGGDGDLYGLTSQGGTDNEGTAFVLH